MPHNSPIPVLSPPFCLVCNVIESMGKHLAMLPFPERRRIRLIDVARFTWHEVRMHTRTSKHRNSPTSQFAIYDHWLCPLASLQVSHDEPLNQAKKVTPKCVHTYTHTHTHMHAHTHIYTCGHTTSTVTLNADWRRRIKATSMLSEDRLTHLLLIGWWIL